VDSGACPFAANHRDGHFQFAPRKAVRRVWSPFLTLEVRPTVDPEMPVGVPAGLTPVADPPPSSVEQVRDGGEPRRTEVFGRFNPSPGIWTGYMLATLALLTVTVSALVWGGAQLQLGGPPHAFWAVPVCVLVLIVMWTISAAGQRLAREEMGAMWEGVERALDA
jgi:hypothetical protein